MTLHIVGTKALLRSLDGPRSRFPRGRGRVRSRVLAALTLRRGLLSVNELADYTYGDDPDGGPDDVRRNVATAVYYLRQAATRSALIGSAVITSRAKDSPHEHG